MREKGEKGKKVMRWHRKQVFHFYVQHQALPPSFLAEVMERKAVYEVEDQGP